MNLQKKVQKYMEKHRMLQASDMVVCAVSGGADSVCLMHLLAGIDLSARQDLSKTRQARTDERKTQVCMRDKRGVQVYAVHVHHGIRGQYADRDARAAQKICESLGIPCTVKYVDSPALAEREHISLEDAARRLRYEALFEEARRIQARCRTQAGQAELSAGSDDRQADVISDSRVLIAVAHNRDDNAETFLMNLCRGAGLGGLSGIAPVKDMYVGSFCGAEPSAADEMSSAFRIIRPLLETSRAEIEAYLREQGINWCTDETNADTRYTRNAVRQELIPYLTDRINAGAGAHIAEAATHLREVSNYLEKQTEQAFTKCQTTDGALDLTLLRTEDSLIQTQVLKKAYKHLESVHLESLQKLTSSSEGTVTLNLPGGMTAERRYDRLYFYRADETQDLRRVSARQFNLMSAPHSGLTSAQPSVQAFEEPLSSTPAGNENTECFAEMDLPTADRSQVSYPLPANGSLECKYLENFRSDGKDTKHISPGLHNQTEESYMNPLIWEMKDAFLPSYTNRLDYDKINEVLSAEKAELHFRKRSSGDRLLIAAGRHKTLKKYMIDDKIPACARDALFVLAIGKRILWVPGFYTEQGLMATRDSQRVLELVYRR